MGALHRFFHVRQAGGVQFGHHFAGSRIAGAIAVAGPQAPFARDADGEYFLRLHCRCLLSLWDVGCRD
ncbi:hypothetical protein D3C87_1724580 [compost metagenome]